MPFIHVYSYSGRDKEGKQKMATEMVKAASEAIGAPLTAFTVAYTDVDRENWDAEAKPIVDALGDKVIMKSGELV